MAIEKWWPLKFGKVGDSMWWIKMAIEIRIRIRELEKATKNSFMWNLKVSFWTVMLKEEKDLCDYKVRHRNGKPKNDIDGWNLMCQ